MYLKFLFLDEHNTSGVSQVFYCEDEDSMAIQVKAVGNEKLCLSVEGRIDIDGEFHSVGIYNLEDMRLMNVISESGLYKIDLNGLVQIKVVNRGRVGNCKVFGVMTGQNGMR